jgi:hypothetical protein
VVAAARAWRRIATGRGEGRENADGIAFDIDGISILAVPAEGTIVDGAHDARAGSIIFPLF